MKLTLWGMMSVVGALGVASCSSEDKIAADENPANDPATNTVNTQFVLSVSTNNGSSASTRMSDENTQATAANFRGIQNAHVLTFEKDAADPKIIMAATAPTKIFDLAQILSPGEITASESRRVVELSLKMGTNTVMFYGKAIKNGTASDQGNIDFHVDAANTSNTYFALKPRNDAFGSGSVFQNTEILLSTILNRIVSSRLHVETTGTTGERDNRYAFWWPVSDIVSDVVPITASTERAKIRWNTGNETYIPGNTYKLTFSGDDNISTISDEGQSYILYAGEKTWKEYGTTLAASDPQKPLEEKLGQAFNAFTTLGPNEVRSGSGYSISKTVGDLIEVINKIRKVSTSNTVGSTATSPEEWIAQLMAEVIYTRITQYFVNSGTSCTFAEISNILNNLKTYVDASQTTSTNVTNLADFPTNLHLPQGAVQVGYTDIETESGFAYLTTSTWIDGTSTPVTSVSNSASKIMWPAELCYFGNSPIRTSSVSKTKENYPQSVNAWVNTSNSLWGDFTGTSVVSATRAVAMTNPINYGTSMLKTTVKYGAATLLDNNAAINDGQDANEIDATIAPFILTGVLIGGQYDKVGWDYLPMDPTNSDRKEYIIYDNVIPTPAIPAHSSSPTASAPVYTLVFDNYDSSIADNETQNNVLVCLEFQNNSGKDFYGQGNLIRNGATFYLVGKLDLNNMTNKETITFPNQTAGTPSHALPPYNTDGTTKKIKRVFIQDYVTNANFVIGANSLKYAFLTVPDLQASQISLGMSVDISWSEGPIFNDVPLGQ